MEVRLVPDDETTRAVIDRVAGEIKADVLVPELLIRRNIVGTGVLFSIGAFPSLSATMGDRVDVHRGDDRRQSWC